MWGSATAASAKAVESAKEAAKSAVLTAKDAADATLFADSDDVSEPHAGQGEDEVTGVKACSRTKGKCICVCAQICHFLRVWLLWTHLRTMRAGA
jgi:hypothetical protein